MNHVLSSPSTTIPGATPLATHETKQSSSKDVGEDIVHPWATSTSFSQTLLSIAIIELFLFRVGQHLISKADFFKLHFEATETQEVEKEGICQ